MSFGVSVGDIVVCLQLVHRVFSIIGKGGKNAPRDLKELQNALYGFSCALELLKKEHEQVISRTSTSDTMTQTSQYLGHMIHPCEETLQELIDAMEQYKEALDESVSIGGAPSWLLKQCYKDELIRLKSIARY